MRLLRREGERAISQMVWMGCTALAPHPTRANLSPDERSEERDFHVIRVKEKEVSASARVRMRLREGGKWGVRG